MAKFKLAILPRSLWVVRHNIWTTVGPWLSEQDGRAVVIWVPSLDKTLSTIAGIRIMGQITRNIADAVWSGL